MPDVKMINGLYIFIMIFGRLIPNSSGSIWKAMNERVFTYSTRYLNEVPSVNIQ